MTQALHFHQIGPSTIIPLSQHRQSTVQRLGQQQGFCTYQTQDLREAFTEKYGSLPDSMTQVTVIRPKSGELNGVQMSNEHLFLSLLLTSIYDEMEMPEDVMETAIADHSLLILDESLILGMLLSLFGSEMTLYPQNHKLYMDGLAILVDHAQWPIYLLPQSTTVHHVYTTSYTATIHDVLHFMNWGPHGMHRKKDAVFLYHRTKEFLARPSNDIPSEQCDNLLDGCLSGPVLPPRLSREFTDLKYCDEVLRAMQESMPEIPHGPLFQFLGEAFLNHPREALWHGALKSFI